MLVSMQEMMQDASQRNYAVGSFATPTAEHLKAVIHAAEELNAPVIIMVAELLVNTGCDFEFIAPLMKQWAEKAKVPVAMHIDHAITPEFAMKGIQYGFNSIMYDCAALPFEENIAAVKEYAQWAHRVGVAVEGEIGAMPSNVVGHGDCKEYGQKIFNIRDYFTKPEQVGEYVDRTGVDLLTVSFGTIHGPLIEEVNLDIDLLKQINAATDCPLVMHGSSGTPDDQMKNAVANGINKVNFYTGISMPINDYMVDIIQNYEVMPLFYHEVTAKAEEKMKEIAKERIQFFANGVKF